MIYEDGMSKFKKIPGRR